MFHMNPELRSLTAICVVEDITKCPLGYTPISQTHDTKSDADLWKDGFWGRRVTRYVCISKSQGRPEHVISAIQILGERDLPPEGFSILQSTVDTHQKPFQKRQLAFKLAHFRTNAESVTDIIILYKPKPPMDYDLIGEINGYHFCVRKISALTRLSSPSLSYGILPNAGASSLYPSIQSSLTDLSISKPDTNGNSDDLANRGRSSLPSSPYPPAPYPHAANNSQYNSTISSLSGVDGVPMQLRDDLQPVRNGMVSGQLRPSIQIKTFADLEREYSYDFRTEREVLIEGS